jgi:hypothetical protein
MAPATLKRRFGDRLCFEGGFSVQTTLSFGDPDALRTQAARAKVEHWSRSQSNVMF